CQLFIRYRQQIILMAEAALILRIDPDLPALIGNRFYFGNMCEINILITIIHGQAEISGLAGGGEVYCPCFFKCLTFKGKLLLILPGCSVITEFDTKINGISLILICPSC